MCVISCISRPADGMLKLVIAHLQYSKNKQQISRFWQRTVHARLSRWQCACGTTRQVERQERAFKEEPGRILHTCLITFGLNAVFRQQISSLRAQTAWQLVPRSKQKCRSSSMSVLLPSMLLRSLRARPTPFFPFETKNNGMQNKKRTKLT